MIFNNAGVALGATVEDMNYDDFEWLMNINFWGVVYGTKAFLPYLKQAGEGHIINISSIFGLVGIPTQSAYNAAKFAVRGFTESLRIELEMENSPVSCTSVHPGGIKTNIAKAARMDKSVERITGGDKEKAIQDFEKLFRTTPAEAASTILKGVRGNKRRVLIGSDAVAVDTMQRLLPTSYQKLVAMGQKYMNKK
jgi:butyryl-CoA dehydrogenase